MTRHSAVPLPNSVFSLRLEPSRELALTVLAVCHVQNTGLSKQDSRISRRLQLQREGAKAHRYSAGMRQA